MKDVEIFVPGRLCLFGEHSDWAGRYTLNNPDVLAGKAIVTGINLGIYANARIHDKFSIISIDENGNTIEFDTKEEDRWNSQCLLDANWFNLNMTEQEILEHLNKEYENYFGEKEKDLDYDYQ